MGKRLSDFAKHLGWLCGKHSQSLNIQRVPGSIFPWGNTVKALDDCLPLSSAKVKNVWIYTSTPQCVHGIARK